MNTAALRTLLIWIATLLIWEAAYRFIGWRPWIFPAPSHVIQATVNLLKTSAPGSWLKAPLVEAVIRPSILAAMRALDPAYPDWMAPVHYRAEPDEVPRRSRPRAGRTPPPADGQPVRTDAPPDDDRRTGRAIGDA